MWNPTRPLVRCYNKMKRMEQKRNEKNWRNIGNIGRLPLLFHLKKVAQVIQIHRVVVSGMHCLSSYFSHNVRRTFCGWVVNVNSWRKEGRNGGSGCRATMVTGYLHIRTVSHIISWRDILYVYLIRFIFSKSTTCMVHIKCVYSFRLVFLVCTVIRHTYIVTWAASTLHR